MTLTPELLLAINVLFVGVVTAILQIYNARRTARHDELVDLRERVKTLEEDFKKERNNNFVLLDYIGLLRGLMVAAGIKVPDMPHLE